MFACCVSRDSLSGSLSLEQYIAARKVHDRNEIAGDEKREEEDEESRLATAEIRSQKQHKTTERKAQFFVNFTSPSRGVFT